MDKLEKKASAKKVVAFEEPEGDHEDLHTRHNSEVELVDFVKKHKYKKV
jgi:hypothetical protein